MHQLIHEPTRYKDNTRYILDLILTDSPVLVSEVGVASPLANLDHCTIFCKLIFTFTKLQAYTRQTWDYKSADFNSLNESLNTAPWNTAFTIFDDIDDIQAYWETLFLETCKTHIPNKTVTIRPRDKPWMSNEVRLLIRKRDRLHKQFRRTKDQNDANAHYLARMEVDRAKANAKKRYRQSTIELLTSTNINIRKIWSITKRHIGNRGKSPIPPLKDGIFTISDSKTKASMFNNVFAEQCKIPNGCVIPVLPAPVNKSQSELHTITVTTDD
jgi:hypothetical protein